VGLGSCAFSWNMAALNYAISKGAKISSNSYGGSGSQGPARNAAWKRILDRNPQHLFVSASGNENARVTANYSPGANRASNHISVASSTQSGTKSPFSNYGTPYVHVFAPGSRIASTFPNNRYVYQSGTSMACPMVSGLAALVMSMRSNLSGAQVKRLIEQNVQVKSQFNGMATSRGLIDVDKTIKAVCPSCPEPCVCNPCQAGCNCPKPCNNRYSDSYCCRYWQYCDRLPANHWYVRGCAGTCNKC